MPNTYPIRDDLLDPTNPITMVVERAIQVLQKAIAARPIHRQLEREIAIGKIANDGAPILQVNRVWLDKNLDYELQLQGFVAIEIIFECDFVYFAIFTATPPQYKGAHAANGFLRSQYTTAEDMLTADYRDPEFFERITDIVRETLAYTNNW